MTDDLAPATFSTQRYLAAKQTVDDRALAPAVLDHLRQDVTNSPAVLEVGAGIGAMVARLLRRDLLSGSVRYVAVDLDADSVALARERLPAWARAAGYDVRRPDGTRSADLVFADGTHPERLALTLRTADAVAVAETVADAAADDDGAGTTTVTPDDDAPFTAPAAGYDLLVGAAFLDLLDWPAVASLVGAVRPGGHCYFPITFDGTTTFAPPADPDDVAFEARLERAFHDHLDAGRGTSRAGRRALARLPGAGVSVVAAAGSDWRVAPGPGSVTPPDDAPGWGVAETTVPGGDRYPADEAYFLHHVLDLVGGALSPAGGRADAGAGDDEAAADATALPAERVAAWRRRRHEQVARGELRYLTHQVDVFGRRSP